MLRALALSVADLSDRRILNILLQALAVTCVIFAAICGLLVWWLIGSDPCAALGIDSCPLDAGSGGLSAALLTLLAAWFLFPGIAIGVVTGFADRIAAAVEQRHYPAAAAAARPIGLARGAAMGLRSGLRLLLFNLLAIPFYVLLLVTGVGPFILFVIVNGIAIGRDLAELAAARHGDRPASRAWLQATRGEQRLMGVLVSVMFLVPFVNFIAPVVGTAMAIHLFNRRADKALPTGSS